MILTSKIVAALGAATIVTTGRLVCYFDITCHKVAKTCLASSSGSATKYFTASDRTKGGVAWHHHSSRPSRREWPDT